jgi:microcystin-dependent protein
MGGEARLMALTREPTTINPGYGIGDVKLANYDIAFTAGQLVEPSADPGWFLLNGAAISRTTYPVLFARFGTTFGAGDGSTTFNLPNYTEGKFPIGAGKTNFTTFGAFGGESTHVLTAAELPVHSHSDTKTFTANSHGHTGSCSSDFSGNHTHSYTYYAQANSSDGGGTSVGKSNGTTTSGGGGASHAHTVTNLSYGGATETYTKSGGVSNAGSGTAHNNMMPYIVIGGLLVRYG